MGGEEWLSAAAASARAGLSARTLKRKADAGELRVQRGTRGYTFLAEDIDLLAGARAAAAAPESSTSIPPRTSSEPRDTASPEDAGALAVRALADELARMREENARLAGELARISELAGQWHGYAAALERRALPPPPPPVRGRVRGKQDGFWARLLGKWGRAREQKGETP